MLELLDGGPWALSAEGAHVLREAVAAMRSPRARAPKFGAKFGAVEEVAQTFEIVEGVFDGDEEVTVRSWPGGSVEKSVLIGFSWRNGALNDKTFLLRHKVGSIYSGGHQETVIAGETARGYVAGMLGMDASGEEIVVTLGTGQTGTDRWQAIFLDHLPDS